MLSETKSRLGIASALLGFQVVVFLVELCLIRLGRKGEAVGPGAVPIVNNTQTVSWYTVSRHLIAPLSVGLLGIILTPIVFTGKSTEWPGLNQQCETNFDGDISGDGVRISIWAQACVLILIALLGSFHSGKLGCKEVGAGLIITHLALIIALLVQMDRGSLTSVDAVIGSMILDAQNVALSIQLASKETLAARWQVWVVLLTQTVSFVVLPITVDSFTKGRFATQDCRCLTVFWWAWLSNCSDAPAGYDENSIFWVYYAFRLCLFSQSAYHSIYNTTKFHLAEKGGKPTLGGITFPDPPYPPGSENKAISYVDYPSTAALIYTVHGVFAMTSMATAEITIRDFNLRPSSEVYSIGQSIAIVIAGATILRAIWVFVTMFFIGLTIRPRRFLKGGHATCKDARKTLVEYEENNPFEDCWGLLKTMYTGIPEDFQDPHLDPGTRMS